MFAEELVTAYPDAKAILTLRDPVTWFHSVQNTLIPVLQWPSWKVLKYMDRVSDFGCIFEYLEHGYISSAERHRSLV
jgi:hypothetical protein